jgi:hypothetical protein
VPAPSTVILSTNGVGPPTLSKTSTQYCFVVPANRQFRRFPNLLNAQVLSVYVMQRSAFETASPSQLCSAQSEGPALPLLGGRLFVLRRY